MNLPRTRRVCAAFLLAAGLAAFARAPLEDGPRPTAPSPDCTAGRLFRKSLDQPNPFDARRVQARREALAAERRLRDSGLPISASVQAALADTVVSATDRVLVILVEFAGTNTFTFTPGVSTWDPTGRCDTAEYIGQVGTTNAAAAIAAAHGMSGPTALSFAGPLHNQIPRPLSAADRSGDMIWTPDFSPSFYSNLIFGNGVVFHYTRADSSTVHEDFTGKSVAQYYADLSGGRYRIVGDVVGWLRVTNSTWWYGADPAPGARSIPSGVYCANNGGIPGAATHRALVVDALEAVKARYPSFNWAQYDRNGDGVIDRLWIIHAGLGEEDSTTILNRTPYGEAAIWSHSSSLTPLYEVAPGIQAGPYIMMPENCGIGVLAHEFGHNLGADDLYAYGLGETSAGFWTLMADDWTGYPIGFEPPALDPWHLDNWGWLDPLVANNTARVYEVTLGQASAFPGGAGAVRGARIDLPDQIVQAFPVPPSGAWQWWGGAEDLANARMTMTTPVAIPAGGATLAFNLAYDIETGWDFLWVQASTNRGASWQTLTNAHTTTNHDAAWIGALYGFPDDLRAAGIGGFSGGNVAWPNVAAETFSLNAFAGRQILVRFWYMTDWGGLGWGPFLDAVTITAGAATLFSASADGGDAPWTYESPWARVGRYLTASHHFYLQWRNVGASGGYDRCLGDSRWRFGPANSGLLVWYNDNRYRDNEVINYLRDVPGYGPKGRMLVVDAHPDPYRDPYYVRGGYSNEGANVASRSLMRDAPFSLNPSVGFTMSDAWCYSNTAFAGRPAVSTFSDALGYYPGAEYVARGPGYSPPVFIWLTKQWDASAVMPSTVFYGLRAPGYTNQAFRFYGTRVAGGLLTCYWYSGAGLGYHGGAGNPADVNGHYGWNARIVSQEATQARVVIWNSRGNLKVTAINDAYTAYSGRTLSVGQRGVLSNDLGPAGATLLAERLAGPSAGTLTLQTDGTFRYTPGPRFIGTDRFTYRCTTYYGGVSANTGTVTLTVVPPPPVALGADVDGDGKADPTLYLEGSATWKIKLSSGGYSQVSLPGFLGGAGFAALAADVDGDGKADPAVYAEAAGEWRIKLSSGGYAMLALPAFLGGPGCAALAADFDGDGKADPAARCAATGLWTVRLSSAGYATVTAPFKSGAAYQALADDFDGDGRADPALYQAAGAVWSVMLSSAGYAALDVPGLAGGSGFQALTGDFDGDGRADPAAYNPTTGEWRLRFSGSGYAPFSIVLPF